MGFYKFIKIKGAEGNHIGDFVPRLYHLAFNWRELKERLAGWTIWWVENEDDYNRAIKTLDELKKTRIFEYKVTE